MIIKVDSVNSPKIELAYRDQMGFRCWEIWFISRTGSEVRVCIGSNKEQDNEPLERLVEEIRKAGKHRGFKIEEKEIE